MNRTHMILLIISFSYGSFVNASTKCAEVDQAFHAGSLKYSDQIGSRYSTLTIYDCGEIVRVLSGQINKDGTFERIEPPILSPDKNFAMLNQVESGEVETPSGSLSYHEVAYCEIVNVRSGCIVARETGEFCGGSFTRDGKWENSLYSNFDLKAEMPRVSKYVNGMRKFTDSPGDTFENLLACDPPDAQNKKEYENVIEANSLTLNDEQSVLFDNLK